jgi:hypothetical protein
MPGILDMKKFTPVIREKSRGPGKSSSFGKAHKPPKESLWKQFAINPERIFNNITFSNAVETEAIDAD